MCALCSYMLYRTYLVMHAQERLLRVILQVVTVV